MRKNKVDLTRHQLREVAFQVNFSMLYSEELEVNEAIENVLEHYDEQSSQEIPQYLEVVVTGVKEHQEELDQIIEKHLKRWTVSRIAKTDLVILRLALFEMLYISDIPAKVSLNEALEIAKTFSDDESRRFVNGVLSSAMNEMDSSN
ncbi:transcription antitermination factor NusB [Vagococcus carniphilus]|uniref:Transcription antitermination protein NusB n=1 Tax=Vagococcus carniphilus TaxID=218144 RepID=A0AAW8U5M2_9ENTE|nr:transcription antitermination factor NusB [Vagococcus carniphilus]MDT2813876.1 transcription antitermination factor NusB [Vagococcus carniphilus]MDT2829879.1 transcription antitermination factor NusB [Vagococcus carniphilus]MDT2834866.1 transcription antitermination factor NusB [Vagococcus carniphilus]MDT2838313.1 transcription antitermination factor NusB [Vagococcus carniphilus]MDT2850004.1 transcription antitermination factor NusB [Vagococcus carniphilus]